MAAGAKLGLALGPPGAMISGFVGSVVGDMAGSKIGEAVCKGGKATFKKAAKVVKEAMEAIKSVAIRP